MVNVSKSIALAIGALSMIAAPIILEAASAAPILNHYGDYGVVEQSDSGNNGSISINSDPFGYSDQYTDSESGLQYLQVRYYDPMIMRFTGMDTYSLLNRYAYANENPIMDDDPSGHSAVGASSGAGGLSKTDDALISFGVGTVVGVALGLVGGYVIAPFMPDADAVMGFFNSLLSPSDVSGIGVDVEGSLTSEEITSSSSLTSDDVISEKPDSSSGLGNGVEYFDDSIVQRTMEGSDPQQIKAAIRRAEEAAEAASSRSVGNAKIPEVAERPEMDKPGGLDLDNTRREYFKGPETDRFTNNYRIVSNRAPYAGTAPNLTSQSMVDKNFSYDVFKQLMDNPDSFKIMKQNDYLDYPRFDEYWMGLSSQQRVEVMDAFIPEGVKLRSFVDWGGANAS